MKNLNCSSDHIHAGISPTVSVFFFFFVLRIKEFFIWKARGRAGFYLRTGYHYSLLGAGGGGEEEVLFRVYVTTKFTLSPVTSL